MTVPIMLTVVLVFFPLPVDVAFFKNNNSIVHLFNIRKVECHGDDECLLLPFVFETKNREKTKRFGF